MQTKPLAHLLDEVAVNETGGVFAGIALVTEGPVLCVREAAHTPNDAPQRILWTKHDT